MRLKWWKEKNIIADKKKNSSAVRKPSTKKAKPAEPNDFKDAIIEALKRTKSIYSVNGKFKSQLVENKDGGWICQIWSIAEDGRERPMLRNVKPFATMEEAIQMAQDSFAKLTGDNRYFANEDIWKQNKPD